MGNVESEVFKFGLEEVTLSKFDSDLVFLADLEQCFEYCHVLIVSVRANSDIVKKSVDEAILDWKLLGP